MYLSAFSTFSEMLQKLYGFLVDFNNLKVYYLRFKKNRDY